MKKEILHDLIERYLDSNLSETEHQIVEQRMVTDADFLAEVELQRAIRKHFGNHSEMRLRSALDNMWKEIADEDPPPGRKPNVNLKFWWRFGAVAFALALFVAAWWWNRPLQRSTLEQPATEEPAIPAPKQEPKADELPQAPIINQEAEKRPIAMENPADFVPNPALEGRIGIVRGDNGTELEIVTPDWMEFRLERGYITLAVQGTLNVDSISALQSIHLFVYSNQPKDWNKKQALFDFPFSVMAIAEGTYKLDINQKLQIRPGLYYLVVGQRRSADTGSEYRTRWVGKFTVHVKG